MLLSTHHGPVPHSSPDAGESKAIRLRSHSASTQRRATAYVSAIMRSSSSIRRATLTRCHSARREDTAATAASISGRDVAANPARSGIAMLPTPTPSSSKNSAVKSDLTAGAPSRDPDSSRRRWLSTHHSLAYHLLVASRAGLGARSGRGRGHRQRAATCRRPGRAPGLHDPRSRRSSATRVIVLQQRQHPRQVTSHHASRSRLVGARGGGLVTHELVLRGRTASWVLSSIIVSRAREVARSRSAAIARRYTSS